MNALWKPMWAVISELTGPSLHDAFRRSGCCVAHLRGFLQSKLFWHISSNFKENPRRDGQRSHKMSKICCKNSVEVERNPDRHLRGPGCVVPAAHSGGTQALTQWDRIYVRTTQTISDPRHPQRTKITSHVQAEAGRASPGSRQVSLTRSQGVSSPPRHFLQGSALLLVTVP